LRYRAKQAAVYNCTYFATIDNNCCRSWGVSFMLPLQPRMGYVYRSVDIASVVQFVANEPEQDSIPRLYWTGQNNVDVAEMKEILLLQKKLPEARQRRMSMQRKVSLCWKLRFSVILAMQAEIMYTVGGQNLLVSVCLCL